MTLQEFLPHHTAKVVKIADEYFARFLRWKSLLCSDESKHNSLEARVQIEFAIPGREIFPGRELQTRFAKKRRKINEIIEFLAKEF